MALIEFLLARIAEDEDVARFAVGPWKSSGPADCGCCVRVVEASGALLGDLDEPHSDHILRHDPARVLTECEAKRRIVERITEDCPHPWVSEDGRHKRMMGGWCFQCDRFLRDLAAVYADHPDYRQEWKP